MTDPGEPNHTSEAAEGDREPGAEPGGQTPHPQDPAEGADEPGGADTPGV